MLRSFEKRLIEPIETLHDLGVRLEGTPAVDRPITAALAREVADILGEAIRAGWCGIDGFNEAFRILEKGIQQINARRGELTGAFLIGEVLIPAQRHALAGSRGIQKLSESARSGLAH